MIRSVERSGGVRVFVKCMELCLGVHAQHEPTSRQMTGTAMKDDCYARLEGEYARQEPPVTTDGFLSCIIKCEAQK